MKELLISNPTSVIPAKAGTQEIVALFRGNAPCDTHGKHLQFIRVTREPQHSDTRSMGPTGQYYVYILASRRNGTLYTGVTNDLARRVHEHKNGQAVGFTKRYGVHMLVWFEAFEDISAAIQHEKRIKKWNRAWKLQLIERENPRWEDLSAKTLA